MPRSPLLRSCERSVLRLARVLLFGVLAQPLPAVAADTYSLDSVLIVPFRPDKPALRIDAEQVADLIATKLGNQHLVMPLRDVPEFGEGYDAYTYMEACPEGKYAGCAFVVAGRAGVDWAITGEVREIEDDGLDEADADAGQLRVSVWFVDVSESEVILTFSVTLTGDNDEDFVNGVEGVFQRVLAGEAEAVDVRGTPDDLSAQVQLDRAKADLAAASLAELETSEGDTNRSDIERSKARRVTKQDIAEMSTGDDIVPWQRYGMTPDEYRKFVNSGRPLDEWREMANGRFGQIVARISFQAGSGPYQQYFDGQTLASDVNLAIVEVAQYNEVANGSATGFTFEAGFGVLPPVEVSGFVTLRSAKYDFSFGKQVMNQEPAPIPDQDPVLRQTTEFGGRVTFIPLPTSMARPTFSAGLAVWKGNQIVDVVDALPQGLKPLGAPVLLHLQLAPGGELSLGKTLGIFAKGNLSLPVGGKASHTFHDGPIILGEPDPQGARKPGVSVEGGVMFRFGVLKKKKGGRENPLFQDEDF